MHNRPTRTAPDWLRDVFPYEQHARIVNGRRMAMVKVARRREHLLFDVPVVGLDTVPVMRETGTTVLAVEAGRTLMLDKQKMIDAANASGIAIVGQDA